MKNVLLFSVFIFLLSISLQSQDNNSITEYKSNDSIPGSLKLTGLKITRNTLSVLNRELKFDNFVRIIHRDESFNTMNFNAFDEYINSKFNLQQIQFNLCFTPYSLDKNKYIFNQEFNLGLNFTSGTRQKFVYDKEDEFHLDTIELNGFTVYNDSTIKSTYTYSEVIDEISINIMYLFKSNPKKVITFYTGLGLDLGLSIYSGTKLNIEKDTTNYITTVSNKSDGSTTNLANHNYSITTENYQNNASFFARGFIPLGIDIRLSNKKAYLNQIHILAQSLLGLEYQQVGAKLFYVRAFSAFGGGVKYCF